MMQKYTVFYNNSFISIKVLNESKSFSNSKTDYILINSNNELENAICQFLKLGKNKNLIIFIKGKKLKKTIKHFDSLFINKIASGGIVVNDSKEMLWINRLSYWDLPKGKVEENEKKRQAALREVEEETGVKNISIIDKVGITRHIYKLNDEFILKKTHWYLMSCNSNQNLKPQLEEDIIDVRWFSKNEIENCLNNTYLSLVNLFESQKVKEIIDNYL